MKPWYRWVDAFFRFIDFFKGKDKSKDKDKGKLKERK